MVRGERELCREEGLTKRADLASYVLEELLIPDTPVAVIVRVIGVLRLTIVFLDACLHYEGIEAHRAVRRTVEEGGRVAHGVEACG